MDNKNNIGRLGSGDNGAGGEGSLQIKVQLWGRINWKDSIQKIEAHVAILETMPHIRNHNKTIWEAGVPLRLL